MNIEASLMSEQFPGTCTDALVRRNMHSECIDASLDTLYYIA